MNEMIGRKRASWAVGVLAVIAGASTAQGSDRALEQRVLDLEREVSALRAASAAGRGGDTLAAEASWLPDINVYADLVGRIDDTKFLDSEGRQLGDRILMRELDIDVVGQISPIARGVAIVSFESENPSEFETDLKEGYVVLSELPFFGTSPLGLELRAGRFRSSFGRGNRLRIFELAHVTRPLVIETFLGKDGFIQTGIGARVRLLETDAGSSLHGNVEILGTGDLPVTNEVGGEAFATVANLDWSQPIDGRHRLEAGVSVYEGQQEDVVSGTSVLFGADASFEWRRDSAETWLPSVDVGAEFIRARIDRPGPDRDTPSGFTIWTQAQLVRDWYIGVRYGEVESLDETVDTDKVGTYLTYVSSDNLRIRGAFERLGSDDPDIDGAVTLWAQCTFAFGARPKRPAWIVR